ncbi:MAG: OmpA family protein [Candidatus Omnitrophica bacterium]|nr:OmpA family protein [Candidatus Omnitrophota bacterium]
MLRRWLVMLVVVGLTAGCAVNFAKRSPWDIQQLAELSDQLEQFKTLAQLKAEEADQLRKAKEMLEQQLSATDAKVGYDDRGLVTRVHDAVLFDSGKAQLRGSAHRVLGRVATVLRQFPNQPIGIEGHTDNQPIKRSGWADNYALAAARANAVADHLATAHQIDRRRITTIGYGEERPIASNDTAEGRQKNRRVEIIMIPNQASGKAYEQEAERVSNHAPYSK